MPRRLVTLDIPSGTAIVALAWCTLVADAVCMITITWRWAFAYEPYTPLGAIILSALMLGFIGAAATVVKSLGRPAKTSTGTSREQQDALSLFPAEDSAANDLLLGPHLLATRRKALL
jgi:hypothetical protein